MRTGNWRGTGILLSRIRSRKRNPAERKLFPFEKRDPFRSREDVIRHRPDTDLIRMDAAAVFLSGLSRSVVNHMIPVDHRQFLPGGILFQGDIETGDIPAVIPGQKFTENHLNPFFPGQLDHPVDIVQGGKRLRVVGPLENHHDARMQCRDISFKPLQAGGGPFAGDSAIRDGEPETGGNLILPAAMVRDRIPESDHRRIRHGCGKRKARRAHGHVDRNDSAPMKDRQTEERPGHPFPVDSDIVMRLRDKIQADGTVVSEVHGPFRTYPLNDVSVPPG